jgi:hypothetical protein
MRFLWVVHHEKMGCPRLAASEVAPACDGTWIVHDAATRRDPLRDPLQVSNALDKTHVKRRTGSTLFNQ